MTSYIYATDTWLNNVVKAVNDNNESSALELLQELIDPKKRSMLSLLGIHNFIPCCQCEHYCKDPDPTDPGWPMMCDDTGRDMVEPYSTCYWCSPKV